MIRRPPRSPLFPSTTLFRSIHHQRQRARPELVRQPHEASRGSARQRHRLLDRIHQNRQGSRFGPPFHVVNLIHRRQIERVRCQSVKSVRGYRDHTSAREKTRRVSQHFPFRRSEERRVGKEG